MQELVKKQVRNEVIERKLNSEENHYAAFNKVFISGVIDEEFYYDHSWYWEDFYMTKNKVARTSGTIDYVVLMVSKVLLGEKLKKSLVGKFIEVAGDFRSYNVHDNDGMSHLKVYVFAKAINIYDDEKDEEEIANANLVYFNGYICKPPVYRLTPSGREISDLIIAVNRNTKKSDYIPCIAWGRMARFSKGLYVGDRVQLYGRIQSREYFKKYSQDSELGEYKTAYEVSITRIRLAEDFKIEEK